MYNSDSDGGGLPTVVMVVVFHMYGGGDGVPPFTYNGSGGVLQYVQVIV